MKFEKLFEDIIDDIGANTKDYRPYEAKDRDNFNVSKNKKSYRSAAEAEKNALNATEDKEKRKVRNWTIDVRKMFTNFLRFEDGMNYRNITVEMRKILGIANKNNDDGTQTFIAKNKIRSQDISDAVEGISDSDAIGLAEFTACYLFTRFYYPEEIAKLSDKDKIEVAKFAANEAAAKFGRQDVSPIYTGHVVSDYEDATGLNLVMPEDIKKNEELYKIITLQKIQVSKEKALGLSDEEIEADEIERKKARDKARERAELAREIKKINKEHGQEANWQKIVNKKFQKAANLTDEELETFNDICEYHSLYMYAMAGWDYSNVNHDVEETSAENFKQDAIEKHGQELWTEIFNKFDELQRIYMRVANKVDELADRTNGNVIRRMHNHMSFYEWLDHAFGAKSQKQWIQKANEVMSVKEKEGILDQVIKTEEEFYKIFDDVNEKYGIDFKY